MEGFRAKANAALAGAGFGIALVCFFILTAWMFAEYIDQGDNFQGDTKLRMIATQQ
jgi:hypothetical protein